MAFNRYPITDFNNLNLDWLVETAREAVDAGATAEESARLAAESQEAAAASVTEAQGYAADAAASAAEAAAGGTKAFIPRGMTDVIVIGDSYAARNVNWQEPLRNFLGLSSDHWHVYAEGSSGFSYQGLSGHTWGDLLLQASQDMTEAEQAAVSHIIVAGGANDTYNSVDTVESAMATFLSDAATLFPNAVVYVGFIGVIWDPAKSHLIGDTCAAYKRCFKHGNGMYLNGVEYAMHNLAYLDADMVHPNETGVRQIAGAMRNALVTGSADISYPVFVAGQLGNTNVRTWMDNNAVHISTNKGGDQLNLSGRITANGSQAIDLATITKKYAVGSYYQDGATGATAVLVTASGNLTLPGDIVYYDGKIQFRPFATQNITSGSFGTWDYTAVYVSQFHLVLPTLWS